MTRGPCPDPLAVEVHALTLAALHRSYRAGSPHRGTIPDAVSAAFVDWYASPRDKRPIPASQS